MWCSFFWRYSLWESCRKKLQDLSWTFGFHLLWEMLTSKCQVETTVATKLYINLYWAIVPLHFWVFKKVYYIKNDPFLRMVFIHYKIFLWEKCNNDRVIAVLDRAGQSARNTRDNYDIRGTFQIRGDSWISQTLIDVLILRLDRAEEDGEDTRTHARLFLSL